MRTHFKRLLTLRNCFIAFIVISILLGIALNLPFAENSQTVLSVIQLDKEKSVSLRLHKTVPRIMKIPVTRYYLDVSEKGKVESLPINPDRRFYDALHIRMKRTTLKDSELIIVFETKETPALIAIYDIYSREFVIGKQLAPELNFLAQEAVESQKSSR